MFGKNKDYRKLDFLVVGVQKSGTSALDYYLRQHPEIGMAKKKEVHFFDDDNNFKKPLYIYSDYHKQFDFSSGKKVYGEVTPSYIYIEPCCRRIWEYNKRIKIIAILRNPVERAFSHWNMQLDRGVETESFFFSIKNEMNRLKKSLPLQNKEFSYVDRGLYAGQIRRYLRFFTDHQLMFVKYEDFQENQEENLNRIFKFLGVNEKLFSYKKEIIHFRDYSHTIALEERNFLNDVFYNDIKEVERLLNWNCKDWY
ncbi:MAG: sulfotransferase domain-containing protein [Marinilabiliaceae bacterium]|nr:sulfotransferase domain-containing protein [Marinilabiliaceae bacterium]